MSHIDRSGPVERAPPPALLRVRHRPADGESGVIGLVEVQNAALVGREDHQPALTCKAFCPAPVDPRIQGEEAVEEDGDFERLVLGRACRTDQMECLTAASDPFGDQATRRLCRGRTIRRRGPEDGGGSGEGECSKRRPAPPCSTARTHPCRFEQPSGFGCRISGAAQPRHVDSGRRRSGTDWKRAQTPKWKPRRPQRPLRPQETLGGHHRAEPATIDPWGSRSMSWAPRESSSVWRF